MLGFATVDLSESDQVLTVWLTSVRTAIRTGSIEVGHTNAVCFDLADKAVSRRAWSMACDRYVVLTDRTPQDHAILAEWHAVPCDLKMLAKQIASAQDAIQVAFDKYVDTKRGKSANLLEPVLPLVPLPLDQAGLESEASLKLTLAVANQVMHIWSAWVAVERERVKRWTYMPGGRKDEAPVLLPPDFGAQNAVVPLRVWAQ
jgi:hypothetical protein